MNSENNHRAFTRNEAGLRSGTSLPIVINTPGLVRRPLPVLARVIDDGCGKQLCQIKFAESEAFEPCLLSARKAMKLCAPDVPLLDVHAVGTALAEQEGGHGSSVAGGEQKAKHVRKRPVPAFSDQGAQGRSKRPRIGCGWGNSIDSASGR
jgi:hypothetical protein